MHYYQFNIADYRKDTQHLTKLEHYIYRTLIDWYYLDEDQIPKETQSVMRRLGLVSENEATALNNVLNDFFCETECGWKHKRIEYEIADYYNKCATNKENGKKGGRPKQANTPSKTQSVIFANPNESELNPNHKPITNNHKPITNIKEKINKKENVGDLFFDVTEQTKKDFQKLRSAKKAPITARAIEQIRGEAEKAGITLERALIECCARGWVGFKADWYQNSINSNARASPVNKADALLQRNIEATKNWVPEEYRKND